MTDRHSGYLVTLDRDIRDDDAQAIVAAIEMVRGVLKVEPIVSDPLAKVAENRARHEILMMLIAAVQRGP